jgi:hypothetical protein
MDWWVCSRSQGQPPGPRSRAMIFSRRAMFLVRVGMASTLGYRAELTMAKRIAVVLSGCGVMDGGESHSRSYVRAPGGLQKVKRSGQDEKSPCPLNLRTKLPDLSRVNGFRSETLEPFLLRQSARFPAVARLVRGAAIPKGVPIPPPKMRSDGCRPSGNHHRRWQVCCAEAVVRRSQAQFSPANSARGRAETRVRYAEAEKTDGFFLQFSGEFSFVLPLETLCVSQMFNGKQANSR